MSNKKVAISQSNYIPWKGYFDNIAQVDEFVLYDDMQYTKRDWRNRNKIKTPNGLVWLTVPVAVKGKYFQKINETKISDKEWGGKHLNMLKQNYSKAKCYKEVIGFVEEMYSLAVQDTISEVNYHFISKLCDYLKIETKLSFSSEYSIENEDKTAKLVDICIQAKAQRYLTGPAAQNYMDEGLFGKENIQVKYYDYCNYKEYNQLHGEFEHGVSILDLLFSEGERSSMFLKTDG
jgi:hypothetical protein